MRQRKLKLKFWGVRGSIPTPQPGFQYYGGNTTCFEIRYGEEAPLVFDAGSGLRGLGLRLASEFAQSGTANIFLTHFHWDHIQGLPFFLPLYQPGFQFTFYSALAASHCERTLEGQMSRPYFPVPWNALRADRRYVRIDRKGVRVGSLQVLPFAVNHPNGAVGYRVESPDASLVIATDHEHGDEKTDARLREYSLGAGALIYDAQFTPEQYAGRMGWGHSTWKEGVAVAREASVKQLVLCHHDPQHDDRAVARIVRRAQKLFPGTVAAREGLTIAV